MKQNHTSQPSLKWRLLRNTALTTVLTAVLCSCNIFSDDKLLPTDATDGINFISTVDAPTRGLITSVGDIKHDGSQISLFGRVTLSGGGVAEIFNGTALSYSSSADAWSYSPQQYWLSGAVYDFAAFYPLKSQGDFTHDEDNKKFTYNGTYVSKLSTEAQEDILVGSATRNVATDGKGTVVLPLKHALAAVRFSVRNATENDFVVVGQSLQGIKNQGTAMEYDGTTVNWKTLSYASGTSGTTKQFECKSGVTTTELTYENTSCTISRVYYRNSTAVGSPNNYSRSTTFGTITATFDGTAMPYLYSSNSSFASNTAGTSYYYYTYDTQVLNGGVTVPISAITSVPIYDAAGFTPNTSGYALDSDGYLLVLPQNITSDAKLNFDTAVATTTSRSITTASTVYKYVYGSGLSAAQASAGSGTLVTYRQMNTTNRTINNVPTVSTTSREVSLADLASITRWEAGKKYDYVITVSTSNILISVTVVPWIDREFELK